MEALLHIRLLGCVNKGANDHARETEQSGLFYNILLWRVLTGDPGNFNIF